MLVALSPTPSLKRERSILPRVVLTLVLASCLLTHECVHDELFSGHQVKPMPEGPNNPNTGQQSSDSANDADGLGKELNPFRTNRQLASDEPKWRFMRIGIDYNRLNKFEENNPALKSKISISRRLLARVKRYYEVTLKVFNRNELSFSGESCNSEELASFSKSVDLMIYVIPETANKGYFAAAVSCFSSNIDHRTTIGLYLLNFVNMKDKKIHEYMYYSTFAHEFTHLLGFSNTLYQNFVDENRNKIGEDKVVSKQKFGETTWNVFIHPVILNAARDYFGCSGLTGVPFQKKRDQPDGPPGSHWDKKFMPVEYMNPTVENPGYISVLSLSLLKATGWFQVGLFYL